MYVKASQLVLSNWMASFVLAQTFVLLSVKEKLQVMLSLENKSDLRKILFSRELITLHKMVDHYIA